MCSVHLHIGSKIFVAVYGKSVVAEPICTAHAWDLLVCVSVVVQCTNVVFKMKALTVSSSAERGIMCDKILSPDTLNIDMGDFI